MLKRILTALIGLIVFFTVIFTHHYVLYTAIFALTLVMLYEVYKVTDASKWMKVAGYISSVGLYLAYFMGRTPFGYIAFIMFYMLVMILLHGKNDSKEVLSNAFITLFITVSMITLIRIRVRCDRFTVILPFICAWLSDTGGYFIGRFFGKHKLVPTISPKKTVEGAIGGVVFATIGSIAYILIMVWTMAGGMANLEAIIKFGLIGLVGSVISQLGDLVASCIKRDFDKKDYGSILPGHGGFLDRFDSVLYVTPFIYYAFIHIIL